MKIHVQKCQNCGSKEHKNILARESGEPDRVYVQCQACQEFVASYVIAPLGYYHHGKGYESFLRGVTRSGEFMSGRRIKGLFLKRKVDELKAFQQILEKLKIQDKEKPG